MAAPSAAPRLPGELDELSLVRAQRGDDAACRQLVELYQRRVFALLSRMRVGSVEDLAQETFLRVFRALPGFDRRGPARLSTWILTIATRLALDELKRPLARVVPLDDALRLPARDNAAAGAERSALSRRLADAMSRLQPEARAALLLAELYEMTYEEIAVALGCDLGTVKSRISRAKAALREVLAEEPDA